MLLKYNNHTCPYLEWYDNGTYCTIHNYKWFKETPCYSHNFNQRCRLGEYIKQNKQKIEYLKNIPKQEI